MKLGNRWESASALLCLAHSINMTRLPENQIKSFHLFQRKPMTAFPSIMLGGQAEPN